VVFPQVEQRGTSAAQDPAFVKGHAAGYAAGLRAAATEQAALKARHEAEHRAALEAAQESTRQAVALLDAAAAAFQQRFVLVLEDAEAVLAASALELAEAVLGYELNDGDRTARAALQRALSKGGSGAGEGAGQRVRSGTDVVAAVRLHPEDIPVLRAAGLPEGMDVELVPDPALQRGDAVALYPDGWLDARLGTALSRARSALLGPGDTAQPALDGGRP
jgi:flagellar assembly protein FliH